MQMNTFDFSFALNLGRRLFSPTYNLSTTLQQTKMPTLSGKQVACLKRNVAEDAEDARVVRIVRVVRVVKQWFITSRTLDEQKAWPIKFYRLDVGHGLSSQWAWLRSTIVLSRGCRKRRYVV